MTDKELLELAAKAAKHYLRIRNSNDDVNIDLTTNWNPLTDDSDALRLAVQLNLHIQPYIYLTETRQRKAIAKQERQWPDDLIVGYPSYKESFTKHNSYAVTRRAIVLAAAEIGKELKGWWND
jgi:hypothetical protein